MKKNDSTFDIFLIFLRLGLTSFGGPIAQLGYFQYEFVQKRKWVSNHMYSELMALAQILPGPLSTQVGVGLALLRGGLSGAAASCIGYVLPSALFLTLFGLMVSNHWAGIHGAWLQGIKIAVVAIVANALWAMGKSLCPDRERAALAILAAVFVSLLPGALGQLSVILGGAIFGWIALSDTLLPLEVPQKVRLSKRMGAISLALFFTLLVGLPLLILVIHSTSLEFFMKFYQTGSLVFGGGHVVLPLLQSEIVGEGLVSNDTFLAGYGAAQVIPGPLFTFAAYLGAVSSGSPQGWEGAFIALMGIFLPGLLLCIGVMPFWTEVRHYPFIKRMILGVNAAVVGLLLSAFYNPVFTTGIHSLRDFALAVGAFLLLFFWKIPAWAVISVCVMVSTFVIG